MEKSDKLISLSEGCAALDPKQYKWIFAHIANAQKNKDVTRFKRWQHWRIVPQRKNRYQPTNVQFVRFLCLDSDTEVLYSELVELTDFKVDELHFHYEGGTLMLPDERTRLTPLI